MSDGGLRILAGHPTDDELAAIVVALDRHLGRSDVAPRAEPGSRWLRAARLEACGHPPIDSATRLTR